jgi:hypothetical protein
MTMQIPPVRRLAVFCAATLLLAACSGQKEPAQKLVGDVEATVIAASPEAAKYVPDQLADVQSKLGALKASLDKQDYAAVISAGPAVLVAAEELATAAAAKKDEVLKALNDQWTGLAAAIPGDVTAIQSRIEQLSSKTGKKKAAGVDLDAAKASVGDVSSLWSKAQAAFASGNLAEAVSTANDVKTKVEALAASLKIDLPPPQAAA